MDKSKEMLMEATEGGFEGLKQMEPGTDGYNLQVKNVVSLYELKLAEDKLDAEAARDAMQRGMESERMDHEMRLKKEETKQQWIKVGGDILKAGAFMMANTSWLKDIMHFETTGTIATKAFQLIGKPKFF